MRTISEFIRYAVEKKDGYEYKYDPDHKDKPTGGGWSKTDEGWSKKKDDKTDSSVERIVKHKTVPPELQKEAFKKFKIGRDPNHKFHIHFGKDMLKDVLDNGHFSLISSGRNPELESDLPNEYFVKRHEELKNELEKNKIPFTECVGRYSGEGENSIIIPHDYFILESDDKSFMVHHDSDAEENYKKLDEIGKKYNQQSVLHGKKGRYDLHFLHGKHSGKQCGGDEWREVEQSDAYTEFKLTDNDLSKVEIDLKECVEGGFFG